MPNVMTKMDQDMQKAIANARACENTCVAAINYCTNKGGKHADAAHLAILIDCADICATSATFMLRESRFHGDVCSTCADICDDCAKSCDAFADDDQMKDCARKCRDCSSSCRQMAKMMKAA